MSAWARVPRLALLTQRQTSEVLVDADLDTLATALYVRTDDLLKAFPDRAPARPAVGIRPRISDAEMITLAVMQALLGRTSEAAGCAMPVLSCGPCFPICRNSRATTSGCAAWPTPCAG